MSRRRQRPWLRWALVGAACTLPAASLCAQDSLKIIQVELADVESASSGLGSVPLRTVDRRSPTYVEERLTDGELFYRLKDYTRAAIILTGIVDEFPDHPATPNALYLLGDSLYMAGDESGAKTRLRELIERAGEPGYSSYVPKALGRLVEIAAHTRDFEGVEAYFDQLSRLPPREVEAATNYYRAKYLYSRAVDTEGVLRDGWDSVDGNVDVDLLEQARRAFEAVADNSPYFAQARYFVGVILTLQGQFMAAEQAFQRVVDGQAASFDAERVVELARLAQGRLYYELEDLRTALDAYQSIPRTSPLFDVALYEIAWVYIRMGDSTQAERALEVLMVAVPDSRYQADALILRGNLLLREGRLADAEEVFEQAITKFKPIRQELDAMIAGHDDPVQYFRELVVRNIDTFDASTIVPPEALAYANHEADMDRALSALSDLNQARTMVREATEIILRLDAALSAENRVNAFGDLRARRQRTTSLRNRVAVVRKRLIDIEDASAPSNDPELRDVRDRRRQLEQSLAAMPTDPEDFSQRDEEMLGDFRALRRELVEMEVQLMGLEARIAATERFLSDTAQQRESDQGVQAVLDELTTQRAAVAAYEEQLDKLRLELEVGQAQVGVGDARYARDEKIREEYNDLVEQERALLAARGLRIDPAIGAMYQRLANVEATLDARDQEIETVVEERASRMRVVIDEEAVNVEGYRTQLAALEKEAEDVVGGVAYNSFVAVRNRFYTLVLEADVGKIDVVWADREEHRMRVEQLSRARAREIQALDNEFQEIMDLSGSGQ